VCKKVSLPTHGLRLGEFGGNYNRQRCLDVLRQVAQNLGSETLSVRSVGAIPRASFNFRYLAGVGTVIPTSNVHPLVGLWYRLNLMSYTVPLSG